MHIYIIHNFIYILTKATSLTWAGNVAHVKHWPLIHEALVHPQHSRKSKKGKAWSSALPPGVLGVDQGWVRNTEE